MAHDLNTTENVNQRIQSHGLIRAQRARADELRRRHGLDGKSRSGRVTRLVDVVVVVLALPIVVPVIILAAIAIKLDTSGPVFFSHDRTGQDGRRFRFWKLRTMVQNSEGLRATLAANADVTGAAFKLEHDPRITRVGRVLRRLSIDELPQLWNVLRGEMSIVGPRPTSVAPDGYELWQTARLAGRPGLTGEWQVSQGKYAMSFDERTRVDIRYLRTRTGRDYYRLVLRTITHAVGRGQGM